MGKTHHITTLFHNNGLHQLMKCTSFVFNYCHTVFSITVIKNRILIATHNSTLHYVGVINSPCLNL